MIGSKLDEVVQRLDRGLNLNDLGELQRMPADLDRAITLRQHHWQVLGALLTEAELHPQLAGARRRPSGPSMRQFPYTVEQPDGPPRDRDP